MPQNERNEEKMGRVRERTWGRRVREKRTWEEMKERNKGEKHSFLVAWQIPSQPTRACPLIPRSLHVASQRLHMGQSWPHRCHAAYYTALLTLCMCVWVRGSRIVHIQQMYTHATVHVLVREAASVMQRSVQWDLHILICQHPGDGWEREPEEHLKNVYKNWKTFSKLCWFDELLACFASSHLSLISLNVSYHANHNRHGCYNYANSIV